MANTGLPWELPYQQLTDPPNGPLAQQQLAEKVASLLGYPYPCTTLTRPAHGLGRLIFDTDLDQLLVSNGVDTWSPVALGTDTGWIDWATAGVVAQPNFSITTGALRLCYGIVGFHFTMVTTAGFASGDISNTAVLTMPGAYVTTQSQGGFNNTANGAVLAGYISGGSGVIYVTATAGAYAAGATFNISGQYLV